MVSFKISKREIKIFLSFFILYLLFAHWTIWNEDSNFAIVKSIANDNTLSIDKYSNSTADRSYYNDHYYSNKSPGLALIALPTYSTWKLFSYFFQIYSDSTSQFLLVVFTSSIYSALLILTIFKISKQFVKNENESLLITVTFGIGTFLLAFATVFYTHATATFFVFLAFYILFNFVRKEFHFKEIFFSGILAGFAFATDNFSLFILCGLIIYLLSFRKKNLFILFLIGIVVGTLPQLIYNFFIFQNPLEFTYKHLDPAIWTSSAYTQTKNTFGFKLGFDPYLTLRLLIDPYKGFFYYSPVLLLSVIGFWHMRKKYKHELFFVLFSFALLVYANSAFWGWWSGGAFGPRYLLFITPFLCIPFGLAIRKIDFRLLKIIIVASVFINLLSLQPWGVTVENLKTFDLDPVIKEKVASFEIFSNPIRDNYLPSFLINGPQSAILESIWNGKINILDNYLENNGPRLPFLPFFVITVLLFFIWKESVSFAKLKSFLIENKEIYLVPIFIIIVFLLFRYYNFDSKCCFLFFGNVQQKVIYRMPFLTVSENLLLYIINPNINSISTTLSSTIQSYSSNQTLVISLGKNYKSLTIPSNITLVSFKLNLNPGLNVLNMTSRCSKLSDKECIGFIAGNFTFQ
jgi:hypothetical protein